MKFSNSTENWLNLRETALKNITKITCPLLSLTSIQAIILDLLNEPTFSAYTAVSCDWPCSLSTHCLNACEWMCLRLGLHTDLWWLFFVCFKNILCCYFEVYWFCYLIRAHLYCNTTKTNLQWANGGFCVLLLVLSTNKFLWLFLLFYTK